MALGTVECSCNVRCFVCTNKSPGLSVFITIVLSRVLLHNQEDFLLLEKEQHNVCDLDDFFPVSYHQNCEQTITTSVFITQLMCTCTRIVSQPETRHNDSTFIIKVFECCFMTITTFSLLYWVTVKQLWAVLCYITSNKTITTFSFYYWVIVEQSWAVSCYTIRKKPLRLSAFFTEWLSYNCERFQKA